MSLIPHCWKSMSLFENKILSPSKLFISMKICTVVADVFTPLLVSVQKRERRTEKEKKEYKGDEKNNRKKRKNNK